MTADSIRRDFEDHPKYTQMTSGSRRKPIPPFGAPALVRHFGLWIPDHFVANPEAKIGRAQWIEAIEKSLIRDFYKRLKAGRHKPRILDWPAEGSKLRFLDSLAAPEAASAESTRLQSFRIAFEWQSMPVTLSLEVREEHLAVTGAIDLSAWKPDPETLSKFSEAARLHGAIERLNDVLTKRERKVRLGSGRKTEDADRRALQEPHDVIYDDVWDKLHDDLFGGLFTAQKGRDLGKLFVDLRGFVASRGVRRFIAKPGSAPLGHSLAKRIGRKVFRTPLAVRCLDTIWPFLTTYRAGMDESQKLLDPVDYAAERFLNRRVLYASALGAQWPKSGATHTPLTIFLYAANNYERQLARVSDRGHMLAAARITALYDRDLIMQADAQLRRLEAEIGELTATLQGKGHEELIEAARIVADKLPNYEQQLAEIGQQMQKREDMEKGKPRLIGGLLRRVVMSRFYQKQFAGLVGGFRPTRIEGFFTYNEAVIRRLGGMYDHIEAVGKLYKQLEQKLIVLNQRVQTAQGVEAQKRAVDFQSIAEIVGFLFIGAPAINDLTKQFFETLGEVTSDTKRHILISSVAIGSVLAANRILRKGFTICKNSVTRNTKALSRRLRATRTIRKYRIIFSGKRRVLKNAHRRRVRAQSALAPK
jgi:hypothetical protein